ncbi:hypothetical protein FRC19_011095 [Serendipita sp. 401]|nr:hypothetical protein FRC19_011095 [Serendipita sp. 401]KAG8835544.1 hypothetical protein FRC18_000313 [Serendipita sp. 400]KAG9056437.1 hypothetical protein FS842_010708 [Serendipita sp. 407]
MIQQIPADLMSRRRQSSVSTSRHANAKPTKASQAKCVQVSKPVRLDTLLTELMFEILEHMDLADALRFRLVSRYCADVVLLAPSILRRLLRHVKAPLPYSPKPIQTLSGREVLSLCRRAFGLEANWKRKLDKVKANGFLSLHRPYHVTLAPGGRYLITAYRSRSGEEHFISLFDLENKSGPVMLASCPTHSSVESITVTWMENKGRQGIAVNWVRQLPLEKQATQSRGTETVVVFIPLETIESLGDPNYVQTDSPWEVLCSRQWKASHVCVSMANNVLAVGISPNTLSFYNLEDGRKSSSKLAPLPHSAMPDPMIFAVKLMCDGKILIVRGEAGHSSQLNLHALEAYEVPGWGTSQVNAVPNNCNYIHSNQNNYTISQMYRRQKTCDNPSTEEIIEASGYLPTITISVESSPPHKGITQYRLFPTRDPTSTDASPKFGYSWPITVWTGHYAEHDKHRTTTLSLSGADRSLGFPFTTPGRVSTPVLGEFMVLDSYGEDSIPSVALPIHVENEVIQCVAWDESSGKIVLATANDLKIWVLDFAV